MTLDGKLVKEACKELWNKYHEKIEELGYTLSKDSMIQDIKEISIVATIRPTYSSKMSETFRKIIPKEFMYKGEKIPVIFFPPIEDLYRFIG